MKRNKNQTWQQFDPSRKENNAPKEFLEVEPLIVQSKVEPKVSAVPVVEEVVEVSAPIVETVEQPKPKIKKTKDVESELE